MVAIAAGFDYFEFESALRAHVDLAHLHV